MFGNKLILYKNNRNEDSTDYRFYRSPNGQNEKKYKMQMKYSSYPLATKTGTLF